MKRIAILTALIALPFASQANGQFNWPGQDLVQPVQSAAGNALSPWPAQQASLPSTNFASTNFASANLPSANDFGQAQLQGVETAPTTAQNRFSFASRKSRRTQAVTLSSWDQVPMHKHALVQAEMTRNGAGAIWRNRLERPNSQGRVDVMDTRNFSLFDYRKMFREARTPAPQELVGQWRGVNKGIVNVAGYNQFIKEIAPTACDIRGDNIKVEQVSNDMLRSIGWAPIAGMPEEGYVSREGFFQVQPPRGKGPFKHGAVFSYRHGQNKITDPVRLLVDKVVVLDRNHLLGRVTANFGLVQIPLSYFTLERVR